MLTFALHIGIALLLGGAIGLERQFGHHPAGLRTNTLVCLGAMLFVSIGAGLEPGVGYVRVASMVVGGIGFLGGGIVFREGISVRGMNTAATLWCSAAVGATLGCGFPDKAALAALAVILTNFGLRPVARRMEAWSRTSPNVETAYRLCLTCERPQEERLRRLLAQHLEAQPGLLLQAFTAADDGAGTLLTADLSALNRIDPFMNELVIKLRAESGASSVRWTLR
jgi:putative Mg2+ transporter-C (MgtC) family protein